MIEEKEMGIGDWGLGIWGLGPIPNPQSPIPNIVLLFNKVFMYKFNKLKKAYFSN